VPVPADEALRHVKPSVRALAAYTLRPRPSRVKLDQNESPYDLPVAIRGRIRDALEGRPWNRYPPFVASGFIGAVARATGWPADGVLVANGSNELIQAILAVTVGPGVPVVIPEPTFTLYRLMTAVNGGLAVAVPLRGDLTFDVDAIVRAAKASGAAVVVLCSPNNPTGCALTREEILRVHDATGALVVVDQAYVEFGGFDAIPLLEGRPRLVVLRTFSKALALAGLRAGYMLAHPALAAEVHKAKLPYNVNFFTEHAAAEVIRSRAELEPLVRTVRAERDRLHAAMSGLRGIRVFPSHANFLCFRVDAPGVTHADVLDGLLRRWGVLVRDVSAYPMLEGCLRFTAGTAEENDTFLAGLTTILGGTGT
jgi:histidinol-phosphate aminotransferase